MTQMRKQQGMAALAVTMVILAVVTIITLFTARVIVTDNKIYLNAQDTSIAFNAAQAGVDYALGYLNTHLYEIQTTQLSICSSASNTYSLPSGTLSNNATYTMTYRCVAANSIKYLIISSTGTSQDGLGRRTVQVTVKGYVVGDDLWAPTVSTGVAVVLVAGNSANTNPSTGTAANVLIRNTSVVDNACTVAGGGCPTAPTSTVASAGNVTASNQVIQQSSLVIVGDTATTNNVCPVGATCLDKNTSTGSYSPIFQFNQSSLANMTQNEIQTTYLGYLICGSGNPCTCPGGSTCLSTYANATSTPGVSTIYQSSSPLSGLQGQIVFIDVGSANTATFNSAFKLGTTSVASCSAGSLPSTLLVNGNVRLEGSSGNATTICGGVYATGHVTMTNGANVFGFVLGAQGISVNTAAGAGVTGAVVVGPWPTTIARSFEMTSAGFVTFSNKTKAGGLDEQRYNEYGIVSGSWKDF